MSVIIFLEIRRSVPLSEEFALLHHDSPFDRALSRQSESRPEVTLDVFLDGVTLPDVFLDLLQGRTLALTELAHGLAQHFDQVRRSGHLERSRLQDARVLVRGLTLVEDLEDIAALYRDLEVLGDLLLVVIVMLTYCVTYSFHARSLFLRADLPDRVQKPGRPCLGGRRIVHRVSVGGADGADGDGDDDDEVTASASFFASSSFSASQ